MAKNLYGADDEILVSSWKKVLESEDDVTAPITDHDIQAGTARLLENTKIRLSGMRSMFEATPTTVAANVAGYDKVILGMVRRIGPSILGNQLIGVQPLTGPNGLAFALRPRYTNASGDEIAFGTKPTFTGLDSAGASGSLDAVASDNETNPFAASFTTGDWLSTAQGEDDPAAEVSMTVDSVPVVAKTRSLKYNLSMEMIQDLASQHNLDANSIMTTIATDELAAEINYESLRLLYFSAVLGCEDTTVAGTYNLDIDTDGRYIGEKGKILAMRIMDEASAIMQATRLGTGTFCVVDSKTYNLLFNAGYISDLGPAANMMTGSPALVRDATVARGRLMGVLDVYRDDRAIMPANTGFVLVGWKGAGATDAGMFYCPYVPLWRTDVVAEDNGQPRSFFKTRAGRVSNPLADANGAITSRSNPLYRIFQVTGLDF